MSESTIRDFVTRNYEAGMELVIKHTLAFVKDHSKVVPMSDGESVRIFTITPDELIAFLEGISTK